MLIKAFGSVPCVSVLSNNLRSIGLKSLKVWFDFEQNPLDFFLWGETFNYLFYFKRVYRSM